MSQTVAYSETLALVEALLGADLITLEKTRVRTLVNSRAHAAFRESDLWDPFLVTAEERVVDDSNPDQMFVPYVGTTSAGTSVTSIKRGDIDTVLRAHDANPFAVNGVKEYEVMATSNGIELPGYKIVYGAETGVTGLTGGSPNFVFLTSEKRDAITGGTISVADVVTSDGTATDALVNATHTLTNVTYLTDSQTNLSFSLATTITSVNIASAKIKFPVVYLTYKRRLTETYGDQDGDTTTLPREWHEYCALGTVADMLQADGFSEKSQAMEVKAFAALQRELDRIDRNRAHQFVNHRVRTHASNQAR